MRGQWVVAIWLGHLARTAIRAILPVLVALALSGGAGAQTHPAFGPNGDHQNLDQCPAGAYLVGFKVKSGDSINQIAIICAPVDAAGHMGAQWVGPPRGGTGGSPARNVTCGSGEIAVAAAIQLTLPGGNANRVRVISFGCMNVRTQATEAKVIGNTASTTLTPSKSQPCNPGNAITQVAIQWGAEVNAVGVNCTAGPKLAATSSAKLAKFDTAFRGWMKKEGITVSATMSNGTDNLQYGNRTSGTAYPIAALSMAITASCIATLVEKGGLALSYTDTLKTRLPNFLATLPASHDPRIDQITIAQLLRHVSGIRFDPTVPPWPAGISNIQEAPAAFATKALATPLNQLGATPGATPYSYNNVNYLLLGMIFEAMTHLEYASACQFVVASGVQLGSAFALGAAGGWQMPASVYANFILKAYRNMPSDREAFMQASFTAGAGTNGTAYGLGVEMKRTSKGRKIWHFGNWSGGPITPSQFSSYFALWDTGDVVVVLMDKVLTTTQQNDLDAAFDAAVGSKS